MDSAELRYADFRRIDLNLLVAFDALMEEKHVGRAAARVFIGQPAMSHALQRLRESLGDPLFVRSGNRMVPTAFALELAPQVHAWLGKANDFLFERGVFDLKRVQTTVRIATLDAVQSVLLPPLMAALRRDAPGIRVWTKQLQRDEILNALDEEEIDLAIGPGVLPFKEWHHSDMIAKTRYECVYSPLQLTLPDRLTPKVLASYEHVALSWRGETGSEIDYYLAAHDLKRNVAISCVSQMAIMRILKQFPLITMQSCLMTSIYKDVPGIEVRPIEAEAMSLDLLLVWHRRNESHPAHTHVRQLVMEILTRENEHPGACPS